MGVFDGGHLSPDDEDVEWTSACEGPACETTVRGLHRRAKYSFRVSGRRLSAPPEGEEGARGAAVSQGGAWSLWSTPVTGSTSLERHGELAKHW